MVELPSEVSLSTADFNHMYSNSFFIASAGCPPAKISQHLKRTTRDREKQTYIQSDLKDLTDDLILPDIIVKRRRGNVSFLPGWNVRGRSWRFSGLRSRRWRRGLRFERGRWRRRWGRRGRGRRRSSRGRRLQLCQPLHADLRKRLSKYRIRTRAVSAVRTRSASLVGSVKDWLELMITVDARVLYLVGAADPRVDYIITPTLSRSHSATMIMSAFALFSTARQAIVSSHRLFSSSATHWYPKLKTHSGSKKRWRALASGAFKRVSSVQSVLSADYNFFFSLFLSSRHIPATPT